MRTKYRVETNLFGRQKIVLQVYDKRPVAAWMLYAPTEEYFWRDARVSDFNLTDLKTPEPCPGNAQETTEKTNQ